MFIIIHLLQLCSQLVCIAFCEEHVPPTKKKSSKIQKSVEFDVTRWCEHFFCLLDALYLYLLSHKHRDPLPCAYEKRWPCFYGANSRYYFFFLIENLFEKCYFAHSGSVFIETIEKLLCKQKTSTSTTSGCDASPTSPTRQKKTLLYHLSL